MGRTIKAHRGKTYQVPTFTMPSISSWTKKSCLVLLVLVSSLANANPVDFSEESENNDPIYSLQEYLNRLATSRNQLYDNYYGQNFMVPDMLRDRRRSSAENNFQLRVRKRAGAQQFAGANFQLRVRKDLLDRIRSVPQIRSPAENNFQLRVRRGRPGAERNFQLRVRRGDNDNESEQPEYGINTMFSLPVRRNLLDQIRDRRFGRRPSAENNFQLRIRRSPEEN